MTKTNKIPFSKSQKETDEQGENICNMYLRWRANIPDVWRMRKTVNKGIAIS